MVKNVFLAKCRYCIKKVSTICINSKLNLHIRESLQCKQSNPSEQTTTKVKMTLSFVVKI